MNKRSGTTKPDSGAVYFIANKHGHFWNAQRKSWGARTGATRYYRLGTVQTMRDELAAHGVETTYEEHELNP